MSSYEDITRLSFVSVPLSSLSYPSPFNLLALFRSLARAAINVTGHRKAYRYFAKGRLDIARNARVRHRAGASIARDNTQ